MTAANFAALQKQLKEQFGIQKSVRFAVYERFDQGDRLTYLVGFSGSRLCARYMVSIKTVS